MTIPQIKDRLAELKKKRSEARQSVHEQRIAFVKQTQRVERMRELQRRQLNEQREREQRDAFESRVPNDASIVANLVNANAMARSELLDLYGLDYRTQVRRNLREDSDTRQAAEEQEDSNQLQEANQQPSPFQQGLTNGQQLGQDVSSYTRDQLRQDSFAARILTPVDIGIGESQAQPMVQWPMVAGMGGAMASGGLMNARMSNIDQSLMAQQARNSTPLPASEPPKRVSVIHVEATRIIDLGD